LGVGTGDGEVVNSNKALNYSIHVCYYANVNTYLGLPVNSSVFSYHLNSSVFSSITFHLC